MCPRFSESWQKYNIGGGDILFVCCDCRSCLKTMFNSSKLFLCQVRWEGRLPPTAWCPVRREVSWQNVTRRRCPGGGARRRCPGGGARRRCRALRSKGENGTSAGDNYHSNIHFTTSEQILQFQSICIHIAQKRGLICDSSTSFSPAHPVLPCPGESAGASPQ